MKLITLDRTKAISYFGDCKVQSNGIEKCLNIKILDKDPEETMTATYSRIFVQRNNLLCCMNQNLQNVMILVFPTKEKCKLIYDAVIKEKSCQSLPINAPAIDENQIFKDCFYLPLVKAVQGGTPLFRGGHQALQSIIAEFVKSFETDEVNYLFNNFPANLLVQTPVSTEMEETFVHQRKIMKSKHLIPEPETSSFYSARTTFGFSLPPNMHKQSIKDGEEEDKNVGTSREKLKASRKSSRKTSNVSRLPLSSTPFVRQRKIVKPMHLFPEPETSSFYSTRTTFSFSLPTNMHKRSIKEDDEEEEKAVGTSREKLKASRKPSRKTTNVSSLTSSNTPNVSVLDKPSPQNTPKNVIFDIVEYLRDEKLDKKLLVFTSNERKQCYEYQFIKTTISFYRCIKCIAQKKVVKIKTETHVDGSKTFDFNTEKHICEPINYLPENYQSSLVLKSSNFILVKREYRGKTYPLLIIFASNDKNMCYKLSFDSCNNFFSCYECKKQGRKLTARLIEYEGKTTIEYNRHEHICQPRKYIP